MLVDKPMKKILVPTDLSSTAELGLKLAVEIAKRCGATLSLVNFTKHPYGPTFSTTGDVATKVDPEGDFLTIEFLKNAKEKLEAQIAKYGTSEFKMESAIVDNEFKHGIDEYLRNEQIDLIVMGTSGEENAQEIFTGNHTEQAIRVSACPVISVRDGFDAEHFKNIVVGVMVISDNRLADGLTTLRDIAGCFDSHIHLVHVRDKASDSTLILDQYFSQIAQIAGLKNYSVHILDGQDAAESLSNYAQQVDAGVIAVIKNSKEGIFRIFSNKFSKRLLKEEGGPVITVNLQNA
jgi:nucleotide-binding universal stress UspA family protein